jgi:hypothetical protein
MSVDSRRRCFVEVESILCGTKDVHCDVVGGKERGSKNHTVSCHSSMCTAPVKHARMKALIVGPILNPFEGSSHK